MGSLRRGIRIAGLAMSLILAAGCSSVIGGSPQVFSGSATSAIAPTGGAGIPPVPATGTAGGTAPAGTGGAPLTTGSDPTSRIATSRGSVPATTGLGLPTIGGQSNAPSSGTASGPPSWVAAGTRISFYEAAASVAASSFAWVEDPSGPWVDPATGKHYRRTDETGEGMTTASGDGVSQYDIQAVDATGAVVTNTLYGIDHTNGNLAIVGSAGGTVTGPVLNGVWINPATLAALKASPPGGILVLVGPYPLGGKTYQAISFATTDPKAYQSYTYDTDTGLLLAATTSTTGATSPLAAPGENPPQGNTQLTSTFLAGVRQRAVPGIGGSNPSWVPGTRQLSYSGTYNFTNPVDASSANLTYPMTLSVALAPGSSPWVPYTATGLVQMPGAQQSKVTSVTGPAGLYWYDPAALSHLSAGQTLDTDPLTGEKFTVAAADGSSVTLLDTLPGIASAALYDRSSGVMEQYQQKLNESGATIALQLHSH